MESDECRRSWRLSSFSWPRAGPLPAWARASWGMPSRPSLELGSQAATLRSAMMSPAGPAPLLVFLAAAPFLLTSMQLRVLYCCNTHSKGLSCWNNVTYHYHVSNWLYHQPYICQAFSLFVFVLITYSSASSSVSSNFINIIFYVFFIIGILVCNIFFFLFLFHFFTIISMSSSTWVGACRCLDEDQPGSRVMYKKLFEEDHKYNLGIASSSNTSLYCQRLIQHQHANGCCTPGHS